MLAQLVEGLRGVRGGVQARQAHREPKYTDEIGRAAVDYTTSSTAGRWRGRCAPWATRAAGVPEQMDRRAGAGRRKVRRAGQADRDIPVEVKIGPWPPLEDRGGTAGEVADAYGCRGGAVRLAPGSCSRAIMPLTAATPEEATCATRLTTCPRTTSGSSKRMATDLKRRLRALQLEIDVRRATAASQKDQAPGPNRLTNRGRRRRWRTG